MSDDPSPLDDGSAAPSAESALLAAPEPVAEVEPDVAVVAPAPAYEAITTEPEIEAGPSCEEAAKLEEDGTSVILGAVETLAETLINRFDRLQAHLDRETRAEATREKVVDRLHAELQEYKQDLLLKMLRPIFLDLIQLHDDGGKMAEAALAEETADPRRWAEIVRGFQQGIEDILYRQGVEPFGEEGDAFDPRRQRAVATVPTEDPTQNKTIAGRVRKGFQASDKVIRPELVAVYAVKKPSA
jgi:molecular chaperone GrpE